MKIKPSYIIATLSVILVAVLGSVFSRGGMDWYQNELVRPALTPPDWVFPVAWNTIFVLAIISASIAWERTNEGVRRTVASLFIANGILNIGWSFLFFTLHEIAPALVEMIFLEATTLSLIVVLWPRVRIAALLLVPYFLWVGFATYLTWRIYLLNM